MDETRTHHAHSAPGPHWPAGGSLTLLLLPERRVLEVTGPTFLIGRHTGADLRLARAEVSRRHCRLVRVGGDWRLYDLDSLNGVFVNDERVAEATLRAGDCVRVGPALLVVQRATAAHALTEGPQAEVLRSIAERLPRKP